jgi:hypothetical protein
MQLQLSNKYKKLGACSLLVAASAFSPCASADASDLYSAVSGGLEADGIDSLAGYRETFAAASVTVGGSNFGMSYDADASSNYGFNHALARTSVVADPAYPNPYSWASGVSTWTDAFVITGGTGLGSSSLSALLQGTIAPTSSGYARFVVIYTPLDSFGSDGNGAHQDQVILSWDGNSSSESGVHNESLAGNFVFEYGTPFRLIGSLLVEASERGFVDFSGNATITEIAVPYLSSVSVTSGYQGYNITQSPVPEPSKMMMLGIGLLALGARLRNRKHRRFDAVK